MQSQLVDIGISQTVLSSKHTSLNDIPRLCRHWSPEVLLEVAKPGPETLGYVVHALFLDHRDRVWTHSTIQSRHGIEGG